MERKLSAGYFNCLSLIGPVLPIPDSVTQSFRYPWTKQDPPSKGLVGSELLQLLLSQPEPTLHLRQLVAVGDKMMVAAKTIWASSQSPGNRWFCSKSEEALLFIYLLYTWLFLPFWTWNLRLLSLSSQHGSRFIHTLQTCSWDQAVICQEVVNFHKVQFIHFYVLFVHL